MGANDMVPWPSGPQQAVVEIGESGAGWITFKDPRPGEAEGFPYTAGDSVTLPITTPGRGGTGRGTEWMWHDNGDGTGYTEPSILLYPTPWGNGKTRPGFHTPYRTQWVKVDSLPGTDFEEE